MKEPSPFEVAPREPGEKAGVFKKRREKRAAPREAAFPATNVS
ncbi:hypothetical protein F4555_001128 [Mobiluncus mulieris]|nr:hypothetical protein [Mobiluncus mulieris]EEJ54252.1 hypothetical protein HMPREF0577_0623 [Mobiluncus mulieris ATCC 35243]MBB5846332.1 hypothetical protein [Mobiluncus mulieris]